jgi:hypothetical protein
VAEWYSCANSAMDDYHVAKNQCFVKSTLKRQLTQLEKIKLKIK